MIFRRSVAVARSLATVALLGVASPPASIVPPVLGGTPWTPEAVARLDGDLDAMLSAAPALRGAHAGVLAVDTASGSVIYAHGADDEYQPASTLKLVVGSAALDKLGPAFRFRTTATFDASRALLRVFGGNDPTLGGSDFAGLAQAAAAAGVRSVDDIRTDAFDGAVTSARSVPYPNGWTWDDFGQDYAPMVSQLSYDENVVAVTLRPDPKTGSLTAAAKSGIAVIADPSQPCDPDAGDAPEIVSLVTVGPKGSEDTVDVAPNLDQCPTLIGSMPLDTVSEDVAVGVNPGRYVRAVIAASLSAASITVHPLPPLERRLPAARPSSGPRVPSDVPVPLIWTHDSQPLDALLGERFWIPSDNLFGELLLRQLGDGSSTESGIAFEKQWLRSIGIDLSTVTLADGCGMSQYDRITPRDLVTILQHDWKGPNRGLVLESLPVGGVRGTIEGMAGTPVAGRVFAKTGSMTHVRGLAGYLATLHHGAVTFAFNVDDWNGEYPALAALRAHVLTRIAND